MYANRLHTYIAILHRRKRQMLFDSQAIWKAIKKKLI